MLADISYAKARKIIFGENEPDYIRKQPLFDALGELGFRAGSTQRVRAGSLAQVKQNALVFAKLLPTRGLIDAKKTDGHWLVWDGAEQVVRDPYRYKKPFWLTSFTPIFI